MADVLLAVTRQRERLQGIWECTVIEGVMTLMVMMCVRESDDGDSGREEKCEQGKNCNEE